MKPLILVIDGIGNFENKQEIDFENLTSNGLFGIFGKTGAGKSTILDSLTLALYNNISRYNGNDIDMINKNRTDCSVSLEFSVSKDVYRIERSFKISKNNLMTNKKHILSRKVGEEYEPMAEKIKIIESKIEELVGLNYDDFTKAVILPQGKFSDFVTLDDKNKRDMLERIFGLEQYGKQLTEKFNSKFKEIDNSYNNKKSVLSTYEIYTKEELNKVKEELKNLEKEEQELLNNLKVENNNKINIDNEVIKVTSYKKTKDKLELLEKNSDEIEKNKKLVDKKFVTSQIIILQNKFDEQLERIKILERDRNNGNIELEKLEKTNIDIKNDSLSLEKSIHDNKEKLKQYKLDPNFIVDIKSGIELDKTIISLDKQIEEKKTEIKKSNNRIKDFEINLEKNKKSVENSKNIINENIENNREAEKNIEYWKKYKKVIDENIRNYTTIENNTEKVVVYFNGQISNILDNKANIEKYKEAKADFKIKNLAFTLAEKLSDGEACPVCGSTNHPKLAKKLEDSYMAEQDRHIELANKNIDEANVNIEEKKKVLENRVVEAENKYKSLNKEREKLNEQLKELEQNIIIISSDFTNTQSNLNNLKNNLLELKFSKKNSVLEAEKIKVKYNLKNSFIYEFDNIKKEEKYKNKLEQMIENDEKKLSQNLIKTNNMQEEINDLKIKLTSIGAEENEKKRSSNIDKKEIISLLEENNIDSIMLEKLKSINFDKLEEEIRVYNNEVVVVKDKLNELHEYNNKVFEDVIEKQLNNKNLINDLENKLENNRIEKGSNKEKLENLTKRLSEKQDLQKELQLVTNDYNNISKLKPLLVGRKFIDFIARKDLEEVVYFASEEFNRLSNGKYSLELKENKLEIEVIDNLLGGKHRTIKSLSGGETFIISLCLSLSLSKKIQMKKNSIIEFFFLDEGFGSLDNEALDKITETLTKLKSDNISIGIITHVDKLKESVSKALYVDSSVKGAIVRIG